MNRFVLKMSLRCILLLAIGNILWDKLTKDSNLLCMIFSMAILKYACQSLTF